MGYLAEVGFRFSLEWEKYLKLMWRIWGEDRSHALVEFGV
jgi:hypothetical protein